MGPETNSGLFQNGVGAQDVEGRLVDEVERRVVLAGVLGDLSKAFSDGLVNSHPITESVIALKLYALAAVQRTTMGITGSNPADIIHYNSANSAPSVRACIAPPHDSYTSAAKGEVVQTRAIMFDLGDDDSAAHEFFGLNMFIEDALHYDEASAFEGVESQRTSGFVLVNATGKVMGKESYIAGETPIVAVRNRQTGDAKVYTITRLSAADRQLMDPVDLRQLEIGRARIAEEGVASVMLPTGQILTVTVLDGELRNQAAGEFAAAVDALKSVPTTKLTDTELAAVRSLPRPQL